MSKVPVGLQLYAVRGEVQKDLPAALRSIRDVGYVAAEPWGFDGSKLEWQGRAAQELRRMFDDSGLACCGFHLATPALVGDGLKRTVEFNRVLGNRYLVIAGDSQRMGSREGIDELAGILNNAAAQLQSEGMFAGYHAHPFDFKKIDGAFAWDLLFSQLKPEVVMQMDIGNCAAGGGDPIASLRKYPGRGRTVHLKEHGGPAGSIIGEGDMDWPTIFQVCDELHRPEWYVVEEGESGGTGFEIARRARENLQRMGI